MELSVGGGPHQRSRELSWQRLRGHPLHGPGDHRIGSEFSRDRSTRIQGNFAVAGSANYELGLGASAASRQSGPAEALAANECSSPGGLEDENRHTFGAAEYTRSNGYGQNPGVRTRIGRRAVTRANSVNVERGGSPVRAYSVVAQAAGVVREDDYDAGRIGFYDTYDPHQGQDSSRFSLAADLETRSGRTVLAQQLFVIARSLRIREDFTGFVTDAGTPSIFARHDARSRHDRTGRSAPVVPARTPCRRAGSSDRSSRSATSPAATRQ